MSWFANPIGLLAFAAVPAVLILHLYRQRHRQVPVSTLFLWLSPEARESSGRTRNPLRRTPSFWLELLAAFLAALFLSGFNPLAKSEATHLVVVLDDTASMGAQRLPSDAGSALQPGPKSKIIARLEEEFEKLGRRTRVTLIRTGVRPTLLCGPAALIPEAQEALKNWQPTAPSHDPRPAIHLARELALGNEIWFLTDNLTSQKLGLGDEVRTLSFGASAMNAAILDARRTAVEDEEHDLVQCTVRSFGEVVMDNRLRILVGEELMTERIFEIQPGKDLHFEFPLPAGAPAIALELNPDALDVDNHALLYPNPDRTVHLGYQLEDSALGALRLFEIPDAIPGVSRATEMARADLVISHQPAAPPAWSLVLPENPTDAGQAEAFASGFLPEKRHPLLIGVTLQGVLWTRAKVFDAPGQPLLSVGDLPLLTEAAVGGAAIYRMNLLPQRSTLAQSPDWPILISNLVELRRAALQGPREVNLVAGQAFEYVQHGRAEFFLDGASKTRSYKAEGTLRIDDLPPYLHYVLRLNETSVAQFAVNFVDPQESDLSAAEAAELSPPSGVTVLASQGYAESPMGRILLLLLFGSLIGDWLYLGKGRNR